MLRPANAIAEQVERLRSHNADLDTQIVDLTKRKAENDQAIGALEPFAEWDEVPDPEPPTMPPTAEPGGSAAPILEGFEEL